MLPRLELLSHLKERSLPLPVRQKLANAIEKAKREGRLQPDEDEEPTMAPSGSSPSANAPRNVSDQSLGDPEQLPAAEEETVTGTGERAPAAEQTPTEAPPASDAPVCEPCEPRVPMSESGPLTEATKPTREEQWLARDVRLLAFLDGVGMLKLANALANLTLSDCVSELESEGGRVKLLARLKTEGLELALRQKVSNEISKALRAGTLPEPGCARPGLPPPVCDKCDGPHETDLCPHFKKAREDHADSKRGPKKTLFGAMGSGPPELLMNATLRRQPGDGNCLFHSLAAGLKDGTTAHTLRMQVLDFIEANPELALVDAPLKDWVLWETGAPLEDYCRRMRRSGEWGGAIEMAAFCQLKKAHVYVYQTDPTQPRGPAYKRIHTFEPPPAAAAVAATAAAGSSGGGATTPSSSYSALYGTPPSQRLEVRVVYQGGVHYDGLEKGGAGDVVGNTAANPIGPVMASSFYERRSHSDHSFSYSTYSASSELTARGGGLFGSSSDSTGRGYPSTS